jgi:PPOX class probable F420-dependent enzyme
MIITITLAAILISPYIAHGEQPAGSSAGNASATKGSAARPARQAAESKKFSAANVEFLRQPFPSHLVTVNANGSPQVTVMWFRYENGAILFTTTTDRVKFRNMQKDPRAVFTVMDPTNMYKWVTVHGKLSVDNRDPVNFYKSLAEHYLSGESLEAWRKTAGMENRTVLKLTPTLIRTMGFPQE